MARIMQQNEEIWKDIEGYEGLYQVSNKGRIRHLPINTFRKVPGCIRKLSVGSHGYYTCDLYKGNKRKTMLVHRLVAKAFIENPNNYHFVNHKDSNRLNSVADNLEWCTASYNMKHSYDNTNRREKMNWKSGALHHRSKVVVAYTKEGKMVMKFGSIMEAERKTGTLNSYIVNNLKGKTKSAGGYIWQYEK